MREWPDVEEVGEPDPVQRDNFGSDPDPFENLTLPERYGDAGCPLCHGRGRISVTHPPTYRGPPAVRLCRCVLVRDILANVNRGMARLSSAQRIPSSPLLTRTRQNLWVTADEAWFTAHLRHVALRQHPHWDFRVLTDADLIQAWLATAAAKGMEIFDADARRDFDSSIQYMTLSDLAKAATLLIIRLGVKSAPNKEMPNVLLEALRSRHHEGLPTWLWDQPGNRLDPQHRCWSELVVGDIADWERVGGTQVDLDREAALETLRATRATSSPTSPKPKPPAKPPAKPPELSTALSESAYDPFNALSQMSASAPPPKKFKKKGIR